MNVERIYGERARLHAVLGEPHRLAIIESLTLSDRSPSELAEELGIPSNLLAHHVDVLEEAGLATRGRSEGDGRRRYLRLERSLLAGLIRPSAIEARSVLFVCSRNSARSQLAAELWNRTSPVRVESAGRDPADRVHPRAVEVAREWGMDISGNRPRGYDEVGGEADLVIAVCDLAYEDPTLGGPMLLHWSIPDPVRRGSREAFRRTLRVIADRIDELAPSVIRAA